MSPNPATPSATGSKRGRGRLIGTVILLGVVGYTGYAAFQKHEKSGTQPPMPAATVIVQNVAPMEFSDRIEAIGTTEANESTALTSNVTETVQSINVNEGQFVPKGTVIAELHDAEEQAMLAEAQKAYDRSSALSRTGALSPARRDADRAALDVAIAQVNDRKIIAPFDGILGLRSISVGDIVNPGTVITTIDDINPIKLEFAVPETYLSIVQTGLPVQARSNAYTGDVFTGAIIAVDPRIDTVTRTLRVKAEVPNPDGKLRAGMLMGVNIVKNTRQSLAVSEEALVSKGEQKLVMVAGTPDDKGLSEVIARPITIGARVPGYVEVTTGLTAGEKVIVEGVIKANPGGKVKIGGEKTIPQTIDKAAANAVTGKQTGLQDIGVVTPTPNTAPTAAPQPKAAE